MTLVDLISRFKGSYTGCRETESVCYLPVESEKQASYFLMRRCAHKLISSHFIRPVLLVLFIISMIAYAKNFPQSSLGSESDLLAQTLSIANFPRFRFHYEPDKCRPNCLPLATLGDRIRELRNVITAALETMNKIGLEVFLDAGTLLGFFRHDASLMPWEDDGDLSFMTEECEKKFPDLQSAVEQATNLEKFAVRSFGCRPEVDSKGKRGLSGRFVSKESGLFVDFYSYVRVYKSDRLTIERQFNSGNSLPVVEGVDVLLPLGNTEFLSVPVKVPADPIRHLQLMYGDDLNPPLQYRQLYVRASLSTLILAVFLVLFSRDWSILLTVVLATWNFLGFAKCMFFVLIGVQGLLLSLIGLTSRRGIARLKLQGLVPSLVSGLLVLSAIADSWAIFR